MAQIFTELLWRRLMAWTALLGVPGTVAAWLGGGTSALEVALSIMAAILALEVFGWTLARTFASGERE